MNEPPQDDAREISLVEECVRDAVSLLESGDPQGALLRLEAMRDCDEEVPFVLYLRAVAFHLLGDLFTAERELGGFLSLSPEHPHALALLADCSARRVETETHDTLRTVEMDEVRAVLRSERRSVSIDELIARGEGTRRPTPFGPKITELPNAPLLGRFGLIVSRSNEPITESLLYSNLDDVVRDVPESQVLLRGGDIFDGPLCPLNTLWGEGFWHWMLEGLTRVVLAESSGFTGAYLVQRRAPSYVFESLALLGVSPDRIIERRHRHLLARELWVPDAITAGQGLAQYPSLIRELRAALLRRCSTSASPGERIYIDRVDPRRPRRVVNNDALRTFLQEYGFVPVVMEELSLEAQIDLMSRCTALVTPHGAGAVHTLFMPEGSLVVELFSPKYVNPCMLPVLEALSHHYFMAVSYTDHDYQHGDDIVASLDHLRVILSTELRP